MNILKKKMLAPYNLLFLLNKAAQSIHFEDLLLLS